MAADDSEDLQQLEHGDNSWEIHPVRAKRLAELGVIERDRYGDWVVSSGPQREIVLIMMYLDSGDEI